MTWKALVTGVPNDIPQKYLAQHVATCQTRSAALPGTSLLNVPRLTTDLARRAFSYAAPIIWAISRHFVTVNLVLKDTQKHLFLKPAFMLPD